MTAAEQGRNSPTRGGSDPWQLDACLTRARSEQKAAEHLSAKGITTYLPFIPRKRQ